MTKKLLITGASGFLGWHLLRAAPSHWRAVGTWHNNPSGLPPKAEAIPLDLTHRDAIWQTLKAVNPDAVMHLAAASSPAFCEANPTESRKLNVEVTAWLAEMCAERGCRLLFTSSSQVYDGEHPPFVETPHPQPKNAYGRQKLEAELFVSAILPAAAIVRVAVMYGKAAHGNNNFLQQWLGAWEIGEGVQALDDEIRSFLSGKSAAEGLYLLLEKGAEGIFNLGGADAISRFAFAEMAAGVFELPQAKINKTSQKEVPAAASRPANLTLDLGKIMDLGFRPVTVLEGLKQLEAASKQGF